MAPLRGLAATPLLFFAVGVSRLLVLAVPATVIGSYSTAIHAFSQTLVALILVAVAAVYAAKPGAGTRAAATRALLATGVGIVVAVAGAPIRGWALALPTAAVWCLIRPAPFTGISPPAPPRAFPQASATRP